MLAVTLHLITGLSLVGVVWTDITARTCRAALAVEFSHVAQVPTQQPIAMCMLAEMLAEMAQRYRRDGDTTIASPALV
jgi:hypothetical protein